MKTRAANNLIDPEASAPKYCQLRNRLLVEIQSGHYAVGDKLCTEKELKAKYKVSTATITRALAELERAGVIWRKQGGGTYVKATTVRQTDSKEKSVFLEMVLIISGFGTWSVSESHNLNWFSCHEIYRGIINNFSGGPIRLTTNKALPDVLRSIAPRPCGVIIRNPNSKEMAFLRSSKTHHVIIRQPEGFTRPQENTVSSDRFAGVFEGMAYLIEDLGHRAIAFITFRSAEAQLNRLERTEGYRIALQEYQIPYRDELVIAAETGTEAGGYAAARRLLERKVHFTAVFADTDIKALGVIKALQETGLNVPADISVLSFDDVPGMENTELPLTTIRVPHYETGVAAVKMLQKRVDAGSADMPGQVLRSRLVIRKTCGLPKTSN